MIRAEPVRTEVVLRDGRYQLLRDGEPYRIRGAGSIGVQLETLAERGGNSFRTWTTRDAGPLLDQAESLGLTVALCLDVARERHGFDYDDPTAVAEQRQRLREEVIRYKDHPALLAWIIGNEINLEASNPAVYDAVNDLSKMIHELDPNHPTTTALSGFNAELARHLDERAPDLDFISVQMYGSLVLLPERIQETGFQRPYVVTEWGNVGHWEMPKTAWGAPVEPTSSEKAGVFRQMLNQVLDADSPLDLGNYVFLWGQKQERTPTWYGLFLASGESTEAVDVMQQAWTGRPAADQAPQVASFQVNGQGARDSIELAPGEAAVAELHASDPEGAALRYRWELREESTATQTGGDAEPIPTLVENPINAANSARVGWSAPAAPGAYRLFVYVYDGQGNAGHANIPFRVR